MTKNADGYLRIKDAGPMRDQYVHRVVAFSLDRGGLYGAPPGWARSMTVHHMDGDRSNNAPGNLLILPRCMHIGLGLRGR